MNVMKKLLLEQPSKNDLRWIELLIRLNVIDKQPTYTKKQQKAYTEQFDHIARCLLTAPKEQMPQC